MLSGIGPHAELEGLGITTLVDLPGVGRNLQDHILVTGLCFEAKGTMRPPNNNLSGSTVFWKSRPELAVPDLMYNPFFVPYVTDEIAAKYPIPPKTFSLMPALVRPQSRGYLRMTTAKHDGPLEIQPNFLKERADVDALVTGIEIGLEIASQPAFREWIKAWVVPTSRMGREETASFLRSACNSYSHPVGTCAMGSGGEAVVDAELRVHGIEGLRVADASIMPSIPSANTNAACVLIGEFVSQRIAPG
jgi:choline dehydrogenase